MGRSEIYSKLMHKNLMLRVIIENKFLANKKFLSINIAQNLIYSNAQ